MHRILICALIAVHCIISAYASIPQPSKNLQLKLVQVLTRHGDRTALTPLPNDDSVWYCEDDTIRSLQFDDSDNDNITPFSRIAFINGLNVFAGNCTAGELTTKGALQHYELGQSFRQRYVDQLNFLSPRLNVDELYVRSTDVYGGRTIQSAEAQLTGLYPLATRDPATPPITIHLVEWSTDTFTVNPGVCPRINTVMEQIATLPAWQEHAQKYLPLAQELTSILGLSDVEDLPSFGTLYDTLYCRQCHGIAWPAGITQDLFDQINAAHNWELGFINSNTTLSPLQASPMLKEFVSNIQQFLSGTQKHKYMLYSAHDSSVAAFLGLLQVYDSIQPPYASHVVMELYQDSTSNAYFFSLAYNGQALALPPCNGETMCSLETVLDFASTLIPSNYAAACGVTKKPSTFQNLFKNLEASNL